MIISKIVTFNQTILGIKKREKLMQSPEEFALGVRCLAEEIQELRDAWEDADYINCVDALLDLCYFAVGILHKMGLTSQEIEEAFNIVHDCNMKKFAGINEKRNTGAVDAVKPEGWEPPEMRLYNLLRGETENTIIPTNTTKILN